MPSDLEHEKAVTNDIQTSVIEETTKKGVPSPVVEVVWKRGKLDRIVIRKYA